MSNKGSCLCGKVRFEIDGGFDSFFLCHCSFCQKDTGSAHASNLFSTNAKIIWRSGQELVKTYRLPSTKHMKSFCVVCGSPVPTEQTELNFIVVPAGCLDDGITIHPTAHIFQASMSDWEKLLDSTPRFDGFPNDE